MLGAAVAWSFLSLIGVGAELGIETHINELFSDPYPIHTAIAKADYSEATRLLRENTVRVYGPGLCIFNKTFNTSAVVKKSLSLHDEKWKKTPLEETLSLIRKNNLFSFSPNNSHLINFFCETIRTYDPQWRTVKKEDFAFFITGATEQDMTQIISVLDMDYFNTATPYNDPSLGSPSLFSLILQTKCSPKTVQALLQRGADVKRKELWCSLSALYRTEIAYKTSLHEDEKTNAIQVGALLLKYGAPTDQMRENSEFYLAAQELLQEKERLPNSYDPAKVYKATSDAGSGAYGFEDDASFYLTAAPGTPPSKRLADLPKEKDE